MLVGLCGGIIFTTVLNLSNDIANALNQGICAGKNSIADFLIQHQGFSKLYLERSDTTQPDDFSLSQVKIPQQHHSKEWADSKEKCFDTIDSLLAFVTRKWQQRWVTLDIKDEGSLEKLLRRPFFILVSVDAPLSLRWERLRER